MNCLCLSHRSCFKYAFMFWFAFRRSPIGPGCYKKKPFDFLYTASPCPYTFWCRWLCESDIVFLVGNLLNASLESEINSCIVEFILNFFCRLCDLYRGDFPAHGKPRLVYPKYNLGPYASLTVLHFTVHNNAQFSHSFLSFIFHRYF